MNNRGNTLASVILIFLAIVTLIMILSSYFGLGCMIRDLLSKDKYCNAEYYTNHSSESPHYVLRSHIEDETNRLAKERQALVDRNNQIKAQKCYDAGYNINLTFDIIKDYNLTCIKLEYINNHLIDYVIDGGYIKGEYSGFLSYGSIEGHFNIIKRGLFEDRLTKNIFYHVDCNNQTSGEIVNYYNEKEFIGYYLDECL